MFAQQRLFLSFFYISYKTRSIDHGATEAYTTRKKIHADSSFRQSPMIRKLGRNFVSSWRKRDEGSSFFLLLCMQNSFYVVCCFLRSFASPWFKTLHTSQLFFFFVGHPQSRRALRRSHDFHLSVRWRVSTRVTSILSSGNDYSSHCDKNLFLNRQCNGLFFFFFKLRAEGIDCIELS